MSELMARLGPDLFEAQHLGENNSVKYRLELRGSNADSAIITASCTLNGAELATAKYTRGLNVLVLDGVGKLVEQRAFDVYGDPSHRDTFPNYIVGIPNDRIVCIVSFDAILSSTSMDAFLYSVGARAWPGVGYTNRGGFRAFRSSYSAIYNSTMKTIVMENFVGNDDTGKVNTQSITELVFDTVLDVGATGLPGTLVDNPLEYQSDGSVFEFKKYDMAANVPADVDIGNIFYVECDVWRDADAQAAGAYTALIMYAATSTDKWLNSIRLFSQKTNEWTQVSGYFTVSDPTTAKIGCSAYHYPSGAKTGTVKVRNVRVSKVSRVESNDKNAGFGVNGIRATSLTEVDYNPVMLLLGVPATSNNKNIVSHKFGEVQA